MACCRCVASQLILTPPPPPAAGLAGLRLQNKEAAGWHRLPSSLCKAGGQEDAAQVGWAGGLQVGNATAFLAFRLPQHAPLAAAAPVTHRMSWQYACMCAGCSGAGPGSASGGGTSGRWPSSTMRRI